MIKIHVKDVGQGDSLILEWECAGKKQLGIIDCNLYNNKNATLEYLVAASVSEIEFIVLSHFHYDHFSGLADIFEFCVTNKIKVKYFYHTISLFVFQIYNKIDSSKKVEKSALRFKEKFDDFCDIVTEIVEVNKSIERIKLYENTYLKFLAPSGYTYIQMAKWISRKVNEISTTSVDINKLSVITLIENEKQFVLLTSDALKKSFLNISFTKELVLAQAPHHGSWPSILPKFWDNIPKIKNCPIIFSVGLVPKDKLPNVETVSFFGDRGFEIRATNNVYGINEYFALAEDTSTNTSLGISALLDNFSPLSIIKNFSKRPVSNGDLIFDVF